MEVDLKLEACQPVQMALEDSLQLKRPLQLISSMAQMEIITRTLNHQPNSPSPRVSKFKAIVLLGHKLMVY